MGFDFKGDGYGRAGVVGQVADDFVGDLADVADDAGRVNFDAGVEAGGHVDQAGGNRRWDAGSRSATVRTGGQLRGTEHA